MKKEIKFAEERFVKMNEDDKERRRMIIESKLKEKGDAMLKGN